VTIPEKFYGQALKMKAEEKKKEVAPPVPVVKPRITKPATVGPKKRKAPWPFIILAIVAILIVAGGFVYFNQSLLFPPPAVETPAPVLVVPTAATNLTAVHATGTQAVNLHWMDTSNNESGYRIDRKEANGTFLPLTNLSINSTDFIDVTVQPQKTYTYRVVATSQAGESFPSNEVQVTISSAPEVIQKPSLPPGGLDSDSDGLSDVEEKVYGTDPAQPDTDGDGFLDGNEVFHLYNPAATAPVKLVDSGLVNEIRASSGWRLLAPKTWMSTLIPPDGAQATIRTGTGETFEVALLDNQANLTLRDWYTQNEQAINTPSEVRAIVTKGGLEGILGVDRLSAFFAWDGKIFAIRYVLGTETFINYRTSFEMILNSLELQGAPVLTVSPAEQDAGGPGALLDLAPATSTESTTSSNTGA